MIEGVTIAKEDQGGPRLTKLAILRTKDKKEESVQLAQEMGFEVIFASPLELAEVDSARFWQFVDELESGKVDMVILTNSTAVKFMLQAAKQARPGEGAVRKLNEKGIIAIGPITADAAKREWIKVTAIPEKFTSDGLVQHLGAMVIRATGSGCCARTKAPRS